MKSDKILRFSGVPTPRQSQFFASRARYTAYGGARGGGKSWALRRKLVAMCLNFSGLRALLIRRTYGEVKSNHLYPMLKEYGGILSYRESEKRLHFPNGSTITLGFCSCERDTLRYQGQEYDVIAIDEATQLPESCFTVLKATLRGCRDFPRRMYLTCNPGGIGHAWVKRLFVDREFRGDENPDDYRFIPALVTDNPVLLKADPGYLRQLESLPKRLRDAWLYGKWDVFEGQFFPEFCETVHLLPPQEMPQSLSRFLSFDYGFDMLAALLLGVDRMGNLFVLNEYCQSGLTLSQAGRAVASFCQSARVEYAVASPDLWNRRQDSGKSGFEIMQAIPGMPPMRAADDRRIPGWRMLREYLCEDSPSPMLRISTQCKTLIRSLPALVCDPVRPEDASNHPHDMTHAPEALRYAVMSRFSPYADAPPPKPAFRFPKSGNGRFPF